MRLRCLSLALAAGLAAASAASAQSVGDAQEIAGTYSNGVLTVTFNGAGTFSARDPEGAEVARGAWRFEGDVLGLIDDEDGPEGGCPGVTGVYAVDVVSSEELGPDGAPMVESLAFTVSEDACEARVEAVDGAMFRNVALTGPDPRAELAGAWTRDGVTLFFTADGYLAVTTPDGLAVIAAYTANDEQLVVTDMGGPGACANDTGGAYAWAILEGGDIAFELIADACEGRRDGAVGVWSPMSEAP